MDLSLKASVASTAWPKVTIMIPTYAQAGVVANAVDSALAQDYSNLEVVVADDASPDDTARVVKARRDPRLRYYRNAKNLGRVGNYRHTLYHVATGDWVVNLDGDDRYADPGFISAAMRVVLSDDAIVMVCARRAVEQNGRIVDITQVPNAAWLEGIDVVRNLPAFPYHLPHMATVYRRLPAMELSFYRTDLISADWESLYRLALRGRVAFIDRVVGVWHAGDNNMSRVADWRARADNLQIWPPIFAAAVQAGMPFIEAERVRAATMSHFAYLGFTYVLAGRGVVAARKYFSTLWRDQRSTARRLLLDPRCWLRVCVALAMSGSRKRRQ